MYDDHLWIENNFSVLRVSYFKERLADLTDFSGWSPRWYLPSKTLTFSKSETSALITVMVVDSANEIKIGYGYDWDPVVLGPNEMQLQESMAGLLGAEIGDEILLPLDFSSYLGDKAVMKLFAIMIG